MIKRLCKATGCVRYRLDGSDYCDKHQSLQIEKDRRTQERLKEWYSRFPRMENTLHNTARWRKESKLFLQENPYCQICGAPSTEVHHNYNTKDYYYNEDLFFNKNSWIPLCHHCHSKLTNNKTYVKPTSLNVYTGQ